MSRIIVSAIGFLSCVITVAFVLLVSASIAWAGGTDIMQRGPHWETIGVLSLVFGPTLSIVLAVASDWPEHVEQSVDRWLKKRADERAMCDDFTDMKGCGR